ncbi:uncharacterized protein CDAR_411811 [Caerostris darwini]|uniref:Uncharacterized protein n=1 Tax=Caerostris darwini TaxID=1538125 RepID=A0AAV4R2Y3_9ARAC|nr:uncharacterized protein CDAR_411811 [Caerostris darwini]
MKTFIIFMICVVGVALALSVSKVEEVSLEEQQNENERSCIDLAGECTNNRNGCCTSTGYSDIGCQCYVLKKDKKRYNTEGPAQTKCWCERTGYWWEKLADKVG